MVSLVVSCHMVVWVSAAAALWAVAGAALTGHGGGTATPHTPYYSKYKYIPISQSSNSYEPESELSSTEAPSGMAPSEFVLTALRTALDVVRNINKKRASEASVGANKIALGRPSRRRSSPRPSRRRSNATETGRGFDDYYDEHDHDTTTTAKPVKQSRYTDPWAGYYDWIINEGSFKFWSVFQLFTAALLLYACFSAIYYAKFNPILPDYSMEYDDYFLERTVGRKARSLDSFELPSGLSWINPRTFQFILDAISHHYEDK